MGLERCNPAIFSGATDCTRPSHHWCPPSPAWEQEEAAARLRAALRTVVSRVVSHIWFGLSGGGPLIYWELDVQVSFGRPRGPGNVRGRAAARLSAKHSDGLLACPHDVLARMDFLLLRLRRGSSQACTVGMRRLEARTDTKRAGLNIILALDHAAVGRERVVVPNDRSQIRLTLDYKNAHSIKCISQNLI